MGIKKLMPGILFVFVVSLVMVSSVSAEEFSFNVGYKIYDFKYVDADGKAQTLTTAIWYPTDEQPSLYTYHTGYNQFTSQIAVDAPVSKKSGPYPLIILVHGGFAFATNYAVLTESLASRGFIVAAADYIDTIPPDFTKQVAFGRIKNEEGIAEGIVMRFLPVIRIIGDFMDWMNADRQGFTSWLTEGRIKPTTFIIDKMLELNRKGDSPFYQTMDENAIGIAGHSGGGTTIIGLVGGHQDKSMEDKRIKAALLLSSGVYPFEDNISNIHIPIMVMQGDNDEPANPDVPRNLAYIKANPPKYYLILKNSTHFSFGNMACGDDTLFDCQQSNSQVQAINNYSLAFFQRYLKGDTQAEKQLNISDTAWAYYKMEEKPGDVHEWGKEPEGGSGGPGGIEDLFRRKSRFKMRLYRGLNMISVPLDPGEEWKLSNLIDYIGKDNATMIVWYNTETKKFSAYLPNFSIVSPLNATIDGEHGYIVNVLRDIDVTFTGSAWENMAPSIESMPNENVWAFAVAGLVYNEDSIRKTKSSVSEANTPVTGNFFVTIKNLKTGSLLNVGLAGDGTFATAFADLSRRSVVELGDIIEVTILDASGDILAGPVKRHIQSIDLERASVILNFRIGDIVPEKSALLQNYPNPFNPETWLPYYLAEEADVRVNIYDVSGQLVQVIDLGHKEAGIYISRKKAAYWNGKNEKGERLASGAYFYTIEAGDFTVTRKMSMVK